MAATIPFQQLELISRIQQDFGGLTEFWAPVLDAYTAAGPAVDDDGGWFVEFANPGVLDIPLDGFTADGEPVTAGEIIEDFRLWDFLAAEYA